MIVYFQSRSFISAEIEYFRWYACAGSLIWSYFTVKIFTISSILKFSFQWLHTSYRDPGFNSSDSHNEKRIIWFDTEPDCKYKTTRYNFRSGRSKWMDVACRNRCGNGYNGFVGLEFNEIMVQEMRKRCSYTTTNDYLFDTRPSTDQHKYGWEQTSRSSRGDT